MLAITRQVEIGRPLRFVQMEQHVPDSPELIGMELPAVAKFVEPLQPLVAKTRDHGLL